MAISALSDIVRQAVSAFAAGAAATGVTSFNTRTGAVTLTASDVTTALAGTAVTAATNVAGGAAGSIPYQTASGTTAQLPIGTAGQMLVVNAGATAPQWAPAPVSKPPLTFVKANATTTAETVVARWAIPANSIVANSELLIGVRHQSAGTGTLIYRLRCGAAGTTADTLLTTLTTSAAQVANAQGGAQFVVEFPTATTAIGSGFAVQQAAVLGTTTAAGATATIAPAGVVFVSVTVTCSAAAANVTQACAAAWGD